MPRCYYRDTSDSHKNYQLHGFSDTLLKVYAAMVYLQIEHINGEVEVTLLASKIRVSPIKGQLPGANILAGLINTGQKSLLMIMVPKVFCWTKTNKAWKPYIQHCVSEI